MKRSRNSETPSEPRVDLTPVMSILVVLIPMLIYAFSFFEIRIQSVQTPKMCAQCGNGAHDGFFNVTVMVDPIGFSVRASGDSMEETQLDIPKRLVTTKRGESYYEYDYAALYANLLETKQLRPERRAVHLGAVDGVPWHVMARTIDAMRLELELDGSASGDADAWARAPARLDADRTPVPLYDHVTFIASL